jgi:hypothetical protein
MNPSKVQSVLFGCNKKKLKSKFYLRNKIFKHAYAKGNFIACDYAQRKVENAINSYQNYVHQFHNKGTVVAARLEVTHRKNPRVPRNTV